MNVGTLFTKTAKTFPEKLAITYGEYELSYSQANERINRLANALRGLGIEMQPWLGQGKHFLAQDIGRGILSVGSVDSRLSA